MECSCIRQTELPGTSRLFADFTYHPDRVSTFYPWATRGGEAYEEAARQVDFPDGRRATLVAALREQGGNSVLLERLSRPGTVAVVTGKSRTVRLWARSRPPVSAAVPIFAPRCTPFCVKKHEQSIIFDQAFDIFWRKRGLIEQLIAMLPPLATPQNAAQKPPAGAARVVSALFKPPPAAPPQTMLELDARFTMSSQEVLQEGFCPDERGRDRRRRSGGTPSSGCATTRSRCAVSWPIRTV